MARRLLQVVVAVAGVMAVAVLARPSDPQVPPPFEIERATPSPAPSLPPSPVATAAHTEEATPAPGPPRGARAVVHTFDPATLTPLAEPLELSFDRQGAVAAVASPDGRHLAVQLIRPTRPGETELLLYDLADLHAPPGVHHGLRGTEVLRFAPDSGALVWMDFSTQGGAGLGGLRLPGDGPAERLRDVALPDDLLLSGVTPLLGDRVGVHGYSLRREEAGQGDGSDWPRGPPSGPLRLLVVDLAGGRVEVDVALPTADGSVPVEDDPGAWLERHAGVAWDPDRDRAYVAHADRDAVLVVDLATGEAVTELATGSPALVAAGSVEARWREATLAAGDLLYVSGTVVQLPSASGDHQPGPGMRELPVLVADLATGVLVDTGEARGRVLAASPGGEHVALVSEATAGDEPAALRLHDGRSLEPRWERSLGFAIEAAFLPGGRHLLLFSADDSGAIGHPGNGWAVSEGRGRLDALDLVTGEPTQTVRFGGEWWQVDLRAGVVVEVHFE